jgi:hypothetical protein
VGRPIVYCAECGKSLPETEFDQGRAHTLDNRPYCATCRPIPEKVPEPALSTLTPRRAFAPKTARVPLAKPPSRVPPWVLAAGGGAVLLLIVILVVAPSPSRPAEEPPPPPPPAPKPVAKAEDAERKREENLARAEQAKLDGFLAEIRKILEGGDLVKRKGEVESMLKSAREIAGSRRREAEDVAADFARRLLRAELRAALVGHWPFDATLGTVAADASGRNQPGKLENGPAWVKGQVGGALAFDGTEKYVEIPNSQALDRLQLGSYTLAAWFRPDRDPPGKDKANNAVSAILVKEGLHTGLSYVNGARFAMNHYLTGNKGVGVFAAAGRHPPGRFYHVAGVVDLEAGEARLYVDGAIEKQSSFPAKTAGRDYKSAKWRIGTAKPGAKEYGWFAHGVVDEVRIYSRALGEAEINYLHAEGAAGRAP